MTAERKAKPDNLALGLADSSRIELNPFALASLRLDAEDRGAARMRRRVLRTLVVMAGNERSLAARRGIEDCIHAVKTRVTALGKPARKPKGKGKAKAKR